MAVTEAKSMNPSDTKKTSKAKVDSAGSLTIHLHGPGMTAALRAGVGGLAASLRAILRQQDPKAKWQNGIRVPLGPGTATVETHLITLAWPEAGLEPTLKALWEGSFRVSNGVVHLPGAHRDAFDGTQPIPVRLQEGMKRTFLQHGRSTTKEGPTRQVSADLGEGPVTFEYQPYSSFAHISALPNVIAAIRKQESVELAGWACPGAAQRHVAHGSTRADYNPDEAVAALFSLVGCISLPSEVGGGGFLVIPEPSDLMEFASRRSSLSPVRASDTAPASLGDAVLLTEFALLLESVARPCVASVSGTYLKAMPWDKKQKYRAALVEICHLPEETLRIFRLIHSHLPPRLIATQQGTTWIRPSHFRAFACDNLVRGRPWYQGFSTHSILDRKKTRYLHSYWATEKGNLGALQHSEREGLIRMTEQLPEAERHLVAATHEAIRNQFGKIFHDHRSLGGNLKKRFQDERQRIRLTFSSAKTQDQVRQAFADLWSRAGSLPTLQSEWAQIMPLVHGSKWMLARDLALVALASYRGQRPEEEELAEDTNEAPE